jgi:hypothetical protein
MSTALAQRLDNLIRGTVRAYQGAFLVWCDPRRDWLPLLQGAAQATGPSGGGFTIVPCAERTLGVLGGPVMRRALQERIDRGESFVLVVSAPASDLGWLWGQALLAERIYDRPLREQLREWGWRPQSLTVTDDELAALARRNLDQDPAEWGGGGLQPDLALLLEVLVEGAAPSEDQRLVLDLTIEQCALPALDENDLPAWRSRALARLLVTQAFQVVPEMIGDGNDHLIPAAHRNQAMSLLERWSDSLRLSRGLPEAIVAADRIAGLGALLSATDPGKGPFLSRAAEQAIFSGTCSRLGALAGRDLLETLAALRADLAAHAKAFWGQGREGVAGGQEAGLAARPIPWSELIRLSQAAGELLDASPRRAWAAPSDAIAWYTAGGWRLDQAGEEILRNLEQPAPELLTLITPIRAAYRARWENVLLQWSELWTTAGCPLPPFSTAGAWLREQLDSPRPTAVMMVDALRYDLGVTLATRLNQTEGVERAVVQGRRTPFPTITPVGMAAALPIAEDQLQAEVSAGKWHVRQIGRQEDLHIAEGRRAWWQACCGMSADALLSLDDVQAGHIPAPVAGRTRLVIYDATIDTLGHDDELEAQGSTGVIGRYLAAIGQLRDAGWLRVLMATDHGYIHWPGREETGAPAPAVDPVYSARRALAYPSGVTFGGLQGLAPGGAYRVAMPAGAACFRTYGGLGFFHGGASLQEWIIPCIKIEWPLQARPVQVALAPLPRILSQQPRVTIMVQRASLLVEDTIPRRIDVVVRDAASRTILFRSAPETITPDRDQVAVQLQAAEGAIAARNTALKMEVRDGRTEEILATADSLLGIEITGW